VDQNTRQSQVELMRLERLEQLARRFDRKAERREHWLADNEAIVSEDGLEASANLSSVHGAVERHGAIEVSSSCVVRCALCVVRCACALCIVHCALCIVHCAL
jgi:hypothetical protein